LWTLISSGSSEEDSQPCAADYEWTPAQCELIIQKLDAEAKTKRIVIDEAGLAPVVDMELIALSHIPVVLLMDPKQHHAVGDFWIDYSENRTIMSCKSDWCRIELTYNENSRFDRPLYDALKELDTTGHISRAFDGKLVNPAFNRAIAYTKEKVKEVNQQKHKEFVKALRAKERANNVKKAASPFTVRTKNGILELFEGMPVVSLVNSRKFKYWNSQAFTITRLGSSTSELLGVDSQKKLEIPTPKLKDFQDGWCVTSHKVQGRTIRHCLQLSHVPNALTMFTSTASTFKRYTKTRRLQLALSTFHCHQ
ncbi:MAG TPA: hypothetical protein V6C97_04750, partial [Oculatellaceae cyanobacterium]